MTNLTKLELGEDYNLPSITHLRFGLRWQPVNAERRGALGWAGRKLREQQGTTDPADWDAGAIFLTRVSEVLPIEEWYAMESSRKTRVHHVDTHTPNPNGCRWCGDEKSHHGYQWVESVGLHQWEAPTPAQRLERMKARRSARISTPAPTPLGNAARRPEQG